MGLFSTVLHIFKKSQDETVKELQHELGSNRNLKNFSKLDISNSNYQGVLDNEVYSKPGIFYLITESHGNWTTIIELNVNIENTFYLYDLTNALSKLLNTYTLSFHFHDDDVLYYNLDNGGESIDGYNSNYQYFLTEPADKEEVLSQRHTPESFSNILPVAKKVDVLNNILNEGYWHAYDNGDLDEDGVPSDDKYFIDEQERFERVGKYLEIFSKDDYPFADWYSNLTKLNLDNCYLLKADR
ncbi:hypothetical protein L0U88_19555 [Flavihumibacter sp. RY-1]|uniref:Uncharacterized protein n=1 Tax=Flavihumibacter fluminis TaxID=2909236 RepID=A0ABS9BM86_9BACT|nr:hypothetical protein [Flavihumibacter fluminis]MCF1716848.1 hypothetical protein [Flavihumibacter fluminis]